MKIAAPASQSSGKDRLLYIAGFAFFTMILLAPAMVVREVAAGDISGSGEGSAVRQIGYVAILAFSIFAAMKQGPGAKALIMPWPLLLALAWCWLSLSWAINPGVAIRRLVLMTIVVWNTFIVMQAAGYERTIKILRILFVTVLIAGYLVVVAYPQMGVHMMLDGDIQLTVVGNWRGLMGHKNIAGAACAMTILLFLYDAKQIKSWIRWAVIAAAAFFLFKAQSKTSAGMLGIALLCGWIFQRYDERIRSFAIPMIMFLTAAGWFFYSTYQSFVLENLLNPKFFTGRGFIWDAMIRYSSEHILLGSGYGSFWDAGQDSPIYDYGQGFVKTAGSGHNGYLDLLVSVGLPGLVLVVFAAVIWPAWKLLSSRITPQRGALAVAMLLFCMGHNVTESSLLERDTLIGVMMMIAVAIAQNWEQVGTVTRKMSGADIFAALSQRRREAT
ncbi:O-antigen ligase [Novosphingobium chloroacetimidivorans]|uniref:O-antigen ligase n=1 Tax=Novosphingobium chloroacetimidivorans TaxID=1428314 RepID=A0A7W7NVL4_9SPHN|nr:O-antigen ligase family protein [Novosphingobium chloroacetimidivorans]MBB4857242.1 O-antigen ligase [Novosphingobium chloroacetimidivorans]